ncbi:hypothetical protein M422DRAFT_70117 [Sphaerobolus stellatus SS14]|uniref:Mitochondrial escape protein 2 n=1 Tax=Sphaerobolus stellatus (strain SS14) TaxID=990650 RepID=A0A0C9UZ74_SPHS4|nr:hypothetical protein M422DRAFT_70117 [Sphaerobolus stellatus SS14]
MLSSSTLYRSTALITTPFRHTYPSLCRGFLPLRTRWQSTAAGAREGKDRKVEATLFLDSVFPVRFGTWDLRHYIALLREEQVVDKVRNMFEGVDVHGFELASIEPRLKDGGIFVKFRYSPPSDSCDPKVPDIHESILHPPDSALKEIKATLLDIIQSKGGLPSWIEEFRRGGTIWRVRGRPWREDMRRYASPILKVSFEGPDVSEERIWNLLRRYGRIREVQPPTPVPAGTLRSVMVTFERTHSAAIAHNCVYGAWIPGLMDETKYTKLHTGYERPIKPHLVRDWLASHPKIVFPIVVFLLGTLTYTVFDPVRAFFVQAKTMGWLDYNTFAVTKWLRRNALDRLAETFDNSGNGEQHHPATDTTVWEDRKEAKNALKNYLCDYPNTITFVHGPSGSGKSRLLRSILEKSDRRAMIINCSDIYAGASDAAKVKSLAEQTGYWPIFSFLNSFNNLIDLASVGLIGQKALPTKPLNAVALADADPASSLSYINQKLKEASVDYSITPEERTLVERVGGRASDLETIIHKVRAGQKIEDAVEDIIQRGVAELRKNAFGDDAEDAKALPWSRQQAWTVMKLLAQKERLPYYEVLLDFPFKGDESALRAMEHAELISITTVNGRPSTIQPGKPVYRYVFQRLLADRVFQAMQDIALNEQLAAGAESSIKAAEAELATLWEISPKGQAGGRREYLFNKLAGASDKIQQLEGKNAELKKVLGERDVADDERSKRWWWVFG